MYQPGPPSTIFHTRVATWRFSRSQPLPARSTLLLYTDGLIERRGESLGAGLTRLRLHAAALAREPLPAFCDELLAGLLTERYPDDVALLTLRLPPRPAGAPVARSDHPVIHRLSTGLHDAATKAFKTISTKDFTAAQPRHAA